MNINWKVRFNKENLQFIVRFIAALLIPALAYMGLKMEDITSWPMMLLDVFLQFLANPYLILLTVANAINIIPDPTTAGIGDSRMAMQYHRSRIDQDFI